MSSSSSLPSKYKKNQNEIKTIVEHDQELESSNSPPLLRTTLGSATSRLLVAKQKPIYANNQIIDNIYSSNASTTTAAPTHTITTTSSTTTTTNNDEVIKKSVRWLEQQPEYQQQQQQLQLQQLQQQRSAYYDIEQNRNYYMNSSKNKNNNNNNNITNVKLLEHNQQEAEPTNLTPINNNTSSSYPHSNEINEFGEELMANHRLHQEFVMTSDLSARDDHQMGMIDNKVIFFY